MRRFILYLLGCLICASSVFGQSLSVFNLDATNFPQMKAEFYAFDAVGNQQDLSPSDITVTENGIARNVISVTCPASVPVKPLSSVLVMDVSGSMAFGAGTVTNLEIAQSAATTWINTLPLGQSECAVTSFSDDSYFNQDFTTNKTKLQGAIGSLTPQNGTNYDAGLWQPVAGGLEVTKLAKHQRVIIFLTDGQPNFTPQTASIIAEAKQQNCLIYSVTVGLPCPQCLKDISTQTGAQWYENITTQAQIEDVYRVILKQAQTGAPPCEITWQSAALCASSVTTVHFSWSGASATASYDQPAGSAAKLQCNPSYISVFPKQVGIRFDTTFTVTAINAPFSVTNITSSNPVFDINPKIFSLTTGQSKALTLSYTPADSNYAFTQFVFQTDQCSASCFANGSFPGYKVAVPTLKIVKPNGGEQYIAGNDSDIIWTGIPASESVSLGYSIDAGGTWNAITSNASGGKFSWHVPNTPSNKCLVKATELSSGAGGGWAKRGGGTYLDYSSAAALDSNGNIYITGAFTGTADFSGIKLVNQSTTFVDMFIAKYHSDGSIEWAKQVGAGGPDGGNAIAVDRSGNIYLTGIIGGTVNFSGISITTSNTEVFLAKYHSDGSVEWVKHWGAGAGGDVSSDGLAIDGSGNIYTSGLFTNTLSMGPFSFTSAGQWDMYMAKLHSDGTFEWAKRVGSDGYDLAGAVAVDAAGNNYYTGFFSGSVDFGGTILNAVGNQDVFIAKYRPDGNMEWAKRAGSAQYDQAFAIGADPSGNVYITGDIQGTSDFDGVTLTDQGNNDIFIAKYRTDGVLEWAKDEGGRDYDAGMGIAVLSDGSFYVTGEFQGTVNFDGIAQTSASPTSDIFVAYGNANGSLNWVKHAGGSDIDEGRAVCVFNSKDVFVTGRFSTTADFGSGQLTEAGGDDVFLWKVGDGTVASSDTSDAVFSIVAPQPQSEDIDMRKVFVSSMKDSIMQGFIRNGGTYPFHVDSIAIVGTNASEFGIVSGIPPYTIGAGQLQQVEFHFAPKSIGIKNATIKIFTQSGTLTQQIQGEGIIQDISVLGNIIDFGQVGIGTQKDTTITIAIQNNGGVPVSFSSSNQLGPDKTQFSIQSGSAPFTLSPGASQSVTLRFAPKFIGRTSGRIGFDYGSGSPAILSLFGQGVGGIVAIHDDSGYAGDQKNIPLILEKVPITSVLSAATNFSARVAYDKSILYASSGNIQHGDRYDTISINSSLGSSDTLALIPFIAMLGDSKTSPMSIVDFAWLDGSGQPADYDAETQSGTFYLLGICPAGGTRLYDPNGQVSMAHINPNPASGIIHIEIQTTEVGRTQLSIMNLLGQKILGICDGEFKPGDHSFDVLTKDLSAGSYMLVMQTPTVRKMQRIEIQK